MAVKRIYKHSFLKNVKIEAEVICEEQEKWRVSIHCGNGATSRDLPISTDIDLYVYALFHAIHFFSDRNQKLKWDDEKIKLYYSY